jgi:2-hydroxychromene-2-carboxylate isomerase
MSRVTFYFDLGSPFAYLASQRVDELLGASVRWQGVSLGALFKLNGRSSWALGTPQQRSAGMADVERRARDYGLAPVRWPEPWPGHYLTAMRATIFAFQSGRGRQFVSHAFALAFQQGQDLSVPATVLRAADEAELDPREVEEATGDPQIKSALREATQEAHERGVFGVPTVAIGEELFWGDDRLEEAARRAAANLR